VVTDPDETVVVAEPVTPPVTEAPDVEDPTDPDTVVTDPDEAVVVAEPVTPPVTEDPDVEDPTDPDTVVTDPDEAVVVAEPVTPPVTEDPDVEDPTDPDTVVTDPDEAVVVAEPVTPPVTDDPETPDDTDIPDEADPSLTDECVCTECSITAVTISLGDTPVSIGADNPMIVGEDYTIEPQFKDDCPPDCPQDFEFEVTFSTYDFNGELIAETTATAKDKIQFSPRRSGNMVTTIRARVLCGETVCDCGSLTLEVPIEGRTVADGVISPVPGATTDPPDPDDPGKDPDDPVHPPVTGPPPTEPPVYPPYEPPPPGDPHCGTLCPRHLDGPRLAHYTKCLPGRSRTSFCIHGLFPCMHWESTGTMHTLTVLTVMAVCIGICFR
jgi:hypothetical protein